MPNHLQDCGTYGAYQRHIKHGEEPDQECREARNAYMRERRAKNPSVLRKQRDRDRVRLRALIRLSKAHLLEYRQLLAEETARDIQERRSKA